MKNILLLSFFLLSSFCQGQVFLNGDFENNMAAGDEINLSNNSFNEMMMDCYSFGNEANIDIITSSAYSGGSQNGGWFIAMTGGKTDLLSLTLSEGLQEGQTYSITFYDKKDVDFISMPIEVGLSDHKDDFGEKIYTSPTPAIEGTWTQRSFSFASPANGKFITLKCLGDIDTWVQLDNFKISFLLDTNAVNLGDIKVYPNPTSGTVLIGPLNEDVEVEVYDIQRKLLIKESLTGHILLDLDGKPGIYFIVFTNEYQRIVQKLIITP